MIVYELRHTIYSYEDQTTEFHTLLFETKEDAIEYLAEKKYEILSDYCIFYKRPKNTSLESLKEYMANYNLYDEIKDSSDYFYITAEEFGHDILEIKEKQIFKFN